jgi:hypothetical protein
MGNSDGKKRTRELENITGKTLDSIQILMITKAYLENEPCEIRRT